MTFPPALPATATIVLAAAGEAALPELAAVWLVVAAADDVAGEAAAPLLLDVEEEALADADLLEVLALLLPQAARIEAASGTPAPTASDRRIKSRRLSRAKRDSKSGVPFDERESSELVMSHSSLLEIVKQPPALPVPREASRINSTRDHCIAGLSQSRQGRFPGGSLEITCGAREYDHTTLRKSFLIRHSMAEDTERQRAFDELLQMV